jgi:hypothetical protein
MYDDELHEKASTYASNRRDAYVEGMNQGKVEKHTRDELLWIWLAHYEGYREGYWRAKGDDRYTTDPVKLKERKACE